LWTFTASSAASGKYLVKSVATGLCISDKDGSTAGNNPIVEETCSDISRMQWSFNYVSGSTSGPTSGPTTGAKPTVAADGSGTYKTVQAAIDAVPANNTTRRVITIKAGTYREIVTIPSNKPYITLQGLGSGPGSTVIVNNHSSAGGYGTSGSATVFINGHDFIAKNLTMSNDYGEGSQAVAASLNADRSVYDNVRFLGNQDTMLVYHYRSYIVNSYVEGTVDFIFGGGTAVFNTSTIYERRTSGGPITAANTDAAQTYGLLFYKCTIDGAAKGVTGLGRPWGAAGQVLYRESSMTASLNTAQPWSDMSGNSWKNARFFEYRNTGAGAGTNSNRPQLSDAQAANYTPQKYLAGTDGWNPL
jgi:pectinesterase